MNRKTKQKEAIKAVFLEQPRPLTVKEVLEYCRDQVDTLNPSTVYRNLKLLLGKGWLTCIHHPILGSLYERASKKHHHHFYCRGCNRAFELDGCPLRKDPDVPEGFVIEDHEVFIHGMCAACSSESA